MPFLLAEILNFQDSAHLKGVGSLSYMIYYELETWKGYIDGFLPLVMVGIVMLVLAGGCFGENDIRLVIIAVLYVL